MDICRLCGAVQNSDEFAVSLRDDIKAVLDIKVPFKEIVEYYCRVSLDPNPDLPQRVCDMCKNFVISFSKFSYTVEKQQNVFMDDDQLRYGGRNEAGEDDLPGKNFNIIDDEPETSPEAVDVQALNDNTLMEEKVEIETCPSLQYESNENNLQLDSRVTETSPNKSVHGPVIKTSEPNMSTIIKLENEIFEDALTNIIRQYDDIPKITPKRKICRNRRKSIFVDESELTHNKRTVYHYFKEIQNLFSGEPESRVESYMHIEIPRSQLLEAGEVPRRWLGKFNDFMTWDEMSFPCGKHCGLEFKNLLSLITHNYETVKTSDRSISCNFCAKSFQYPNAFPAYINHVGNRHDYTYLKFCCIICSITFYNMPHLGEHYKTQHKNVHLPIFPCLECGHYFANMTALVHHKRSHDKKRKI